MKEVSAKTLTRYYAVALLIVATLSVVCHVVLAGELHLGESSAALINLSGRQRMLSQRIASMAAQYKLGEPGARQELETATDNFERGHEHLLADLNSGGASETETASLQAIYRSESGSLDRESREYVAAARKVSALQVDDPAFQASLDSLFALSRSPLLHDLDAVVAVRQHEAEVRIARLQHIQLGILAIVLATLLVEAFTIFRPMVGRIVQYAARLTHLATTDPLTGAANRRCFLEGGNAELERARRYGHPVSVLALDVDHFKRINDTHGHPAGDRVLVDLVAALKRGLRANDLLGRIGGEEFAVLLPETSLGAAIEVAEHLRRSASAMTVHHDGRMVTLTVSIGVSEVSLESQKADESLFEAMKAADEALYRAKSGGRNQAVAARVEAVRVEEVQVEAVQIEEVWVEGPEPSPSI
jgi:diguanylate cyclase (GGDEF)-like protein